jgi:hypothetical protein
MNIKKYTQNWVIKQLQLFKTKKVFFQEDNMNFSFYDKKTNKSISLLEDEDEKVVYIIKREALKDLEIIISKGEVVISEKVYIDSKKDDSKYQLRIAIPCDNHVKEEFLFILNSMQKMCEEKETRNVSYEDIEPLMLANQF